MTNDAGIADCTEETGAGYLSGGAGAADAPGACALTQGIFSTDPCPTAMRLGGCVYYCGTTNEFVIFFYGPGADTGISTAMQVEQVCMAMQLPYVP
jgi:hypothetical protein